ncbi:MAG: PEP-CTERM sorting domain-containing protein [Pseudomonadota bacterium]
MNWNLRHALAVLAMMPGASSAADVYSGTLSFDSQDQSIWGSGAAFQFNYNDFFGIDPAPVSTTINPAASSGSAGPSSWSVDPYMLFQSDFRLGIDVGASVDSGSIDTRLDYAVNFQTPDTIVKGQAFSLTGMASQLASSGFATQAPNAAAYVDGIVKTKFEGYMRFVTGGVMGNNDYRMGDLGFTNNNSGNTPYRTLVNVDLSPEIVSFNRDGSGQLKVAGINQGGVGSSYDVGATTITAGDWRVSPTGALSGSTLTGSDQTTLLTAELDVDQLATGGLPVLGTGVNHDWGVIKIDMGYELIDLTASLAMGMKQNLTVNSNLMVTLNFSEEVLINGVATQSYTGSMDALPEITLLTDSVVVTPEFLVLATLLNDTDLTFDGSLALTVLEAHAKATYDFSYLFSNYKGTAFDGSVGPLYEWDDTIPLFDIGVYNQAFALGGFQAIEGESFTLTAVPEPQTYALYLAGLGLTGWMARRRRTL